MRLNFRSGFKDIPVGQDAASRYVPWVIGLMVFLLALILAGASSMSTSLNKWHMGIANKLTVEVPVSDKQSGQAVVQKVIDQLKKVQGIKSVEVVDGQHLLSLLEPWVGSVDVLQDIQLPILLDVDLVPEVSINLQELTAELRKITAGVRLEAHSRWQEMLIVLRSALQTIAYFIALLIVSAVIITIILVTKTGLTAHQGIIDVLRLIGASQNYIARQFQLQAFWLAFRGGGVGAGVAIPTVLLLNWLTQFFGVPEILKPDFSFQVFIMIAILPLVVAFISSFVARVAVFRSFGQVS
jgi:cell division transport system permease protein